MVAKTDQREIVWLIMFVSEKDYLNHFPRNKETDFERPLFVERNELEGARSSRSDSIKPARSRRMGRAMRVIVVGGKKVGKTAILRQVACVEDITNKVTTLPWLTANFAILAIRTNHWRHVSSASGRTGQG